ncbi:MAG: ECF transporter S component, partial [Ruminiclostridium sp.]|nr:ECF transporter S component [Ruminiclostridium sp.]
MSNKNTEKKMNVSTVVGIGLLTAIVVVLQLVSMALRFGMFSITLTLVHIVVGAALYNWKAGAWLGLVFGGAVLISGDATVFLQINAIGTIITVLAKGALAGLAAGLIYHLVSKKNQIAGVIAAAIAAPVVNTGVFLIGSAVFFLDAISMWAGETNVFIYMLVGLVGFNF